MTDIAQDHAPTHLTAAETRLTAMMSRPKIIALGCVVVLTASGWLALAFLVAGDPSSWSQASDAGLWSWQALCRPALAEGPGSLAVAIPMWAAMTLAMMLPTAGPMILTYSEIADTAVRQREPVVTPLVLTAGYVAVWLGFAIAAAVLQWTLARSGLLEGGSLGKFASAALFVAAGLYQFSPLKKSCLTQCQRPFPFFFANWTAEQAGVFRLGVRQGLYCLGCCWAMMLLMFATGAMNAIWMAALGVVMTIEKLTVTPRFRQAVGVVLVTIGMALGVWPLA